MRKFISLDRKKRDFFFLLESELWNRKKSGKYGRNQFEITKFRPIMVEGGNYLFLYLHFFSTT